MWRGVGGQFIVSATEVLHKGVAGNPAVLPPDEILEMATRNGANALGLPVGSVTPGLKADLILDRLDDYHLQPSIAETVRTNIVHAARGSDVDMVMVDGRIVVQGGRLLDSRWFDLPQRARHVGVELLNLTLDEVPRTR